MSSSALQPELDFLRGLVTIGDFLDDPTSSELSIKALKSLLDVGLCESMSWARWSAIKWVPNQPRALAANTYDKNVNEGEDYPSIKGDASGADADAIFKRGMLHPQHQEVRVLPPFWS